MWTGYVKNHLLPRLFGFELLMAPYAVAHFKLSMQLAGRDLPPEMAEKWAYIPEEGERLGVYLTDALEEAHEMTGLPLFTQWVSDETIAANKVKRHLPVLVVMGNPPYSYESENNGEWISSLIRDYYEVDGKPLGERNPKGLQDDYVKFIRFAQWRVEQSGSGIVAFISNNGYLDNPTFRGMRQSLMKTFDEIYILDLHGNSKKKEVSPDGSKDENVFDIQQGVSIGVFVKKTQEIDNAKIYHADLWGRRANKYETLLEDEIKTTNWNRLDPKSQFYLFTPQDKNLLEEYNHCNSINSVFDLNSVGIATSRDKLTIHFSANNALNVVEKFVSMSPEQARAEFNLGKDTRDWKVHLAQEDLKKNETSIDFVKRILYRPFDFRYTYYTGVTRGFISMPRYKLIRHMLHSNMGLFVGRQGQAIGGDEWNLIFCGNVMEDYNLYRRGNNACFPLYIYPDADERGQKSLFDTPVWQADEANDGRVPNLDPAFVAEISEKLGLVFQPNQTGFDEKFFTPEDIFHYIYAIFHSPTYRIRYAEFLKIDFPRVPLTSDVDLFRTLCELGKELVGLHLLESPEVSQHITRYPVAGDNLVEKGYPKYHPHPNLPPQGEGIKDSPPSGGDVRRTEGGGRVQINKIQYFEGISPEVWEFHVGGYQVLDKWLKDRRGRQLSYDDLTHYQNIVVSLEKTIQLMKEIDQTIPEFPIK
jgi:predicted helicase